MRNVSKVFEPGTANRVSNSEADKALRNEALRYALSFHDGHGSSEYVVKVASIFLKFLQGK